MTTVPPTEQRTLNLLNRHHDDEVKRAAKITDKVGRIGVWLHERTSRAELTLAMIDQVVNDLSDERQALADALENIRCYEALLDRTGGVQPVEAAARAAVESSQPLRVLPDPGVCICDRHGDHAGCGPDCPCAEPEPEPDEPGPARSHPDESVRTRNGGAPVVHSPLAGLVCAVEQHPAGDATGLLHDERWICGTPVGQRPCPQHGMTAAAGRDGAA